MGVVDLGLGLGGREDGARLDDSACAGRFALLEELVGCEGLDNGTVARALTMALLLLSVEAAEGEEYAEPAGVVAALRRRRSCCCCCEEE
jgi:hypothetical protein